MKINKSDMTVIQDKREQYPLVFPAAKVEIRTLLVGGYSLKNFEDQIAIEQKTLPALVTSLSIDSSRFAYEVQKLKTYECGALIIEAPLSMLNSCNWRYKIPSRSVVRSLLQLSIGGLHVVWAENRQMAATIIEGLLVSFLRSKADEDGKAALRVS